MTSPTNSVAPDEEMPWRVAIRRKHTIVDGAAQDWYARAIQGDFS